MKNWKVIMVLLLVLLIMPTLTKAESIINNNGVEIDVEDYNQFLNVYSEEYLMMMTEEKYSELKLLDFNNIKKQTEYVETTYNPHLNLTTEKIITEDAYNTYSSSAANIYSATQNYSTTSKKIEITLISGSTWHHVVTASTWKVIPKIRSFDVIGMRGYGFEFRDGSQVGEQIYVEDGTYNTISYAWNGTNIKRFDNGFGISMNIVNNDIEALQVWIECDVKATSQYPEIYGSYQHATGTLSLTKSQNYTLGSEGLGRVFVYPYSITSVYDGMSGVYLEY